MALISMQTTVSTKATKVTAGAVPGSSWHLKNTGALVVYLGPASVTTATGYPLAPGESVDLRLWANDEVYAVATAAGSVAAIGTGV